MQDPKRDDTIARVDVRVEELPGWLCVCLRHVGPYGSPSLIPSFRRVIRWVAQHGALMPGWRFIGLSYDDPAQVAAAALRYDVCLTVAAPVDAMPEDFRCEVVGAGRWAVHTLAGPYSGIAGRFRHLRETWLPASGELMDRRPYMEVYLNDPGDVAESGLLTELCIPLRAA